VLNTDDEGAISGGQYYGDSGQIDMLWTPLQPHQGGHERNKRGNPHLDIKEVLAIWRESVDEDLRKQWLNIDPTEEDRVLPETTAIATTEQPAADTATSVAAASAGTPATASVSGSTAAAAETVEISGGIAAAAASETTVAAEAPAAAQGTGVAEGAGGAEGAGSAETSGSTSP
jgi:hypothetical protein